MGGEGEGGEGKQGYRLMHVWIRRLNDKEDCDGNEGVEKAEFG